MLGTVLVATTVSLTIGLGALLAKGLISLTLLLISGPSARSAESA